MAAEGIDCLSPVSAAEAAQLAAMGITFIARYIATKGDSSLSRDEIAGIHAASREVVLVYETTGTAALGGAVAGKQLGAAAAYGALALSAPAGSCVYVAETDFDLQQSDVATVQAFYDAVTAELHGFGFRSGGYGGLRAATSLPGHVDLIWQTYAWSGSDWFTGAALEQYENGVILAGIPCDRDRALTADYGQWPAHVDPPPAMEDDDMSLVIISTQDASGNNTGSYLVDTASGARGGLVSDAATSVPHVTMTADAYNGFVAALPAKTEVVE